MTATPTTATREDHLASLPSSIEHYIGGQHVPSLDGATVPVTGSVTGTVAPSRLGTCSPPM